MPLYVYECEDCEISWEIYASIKKCPKRKRCPSCNKLRDKLITGGSGVIFKGFGWDRNSIRDEKYAKKGMSKDEANEFLGDSIKYSKERIKTGGQNYSRWEPNLDKMVETGEAKRVSDTRAAEKKEVAKKITEDAYGKLGLKPGWKDKY